MAIKNAESQYKMDKAACDGMSGNAKDVCVEEAKGKEKVAKAEADAAFQNTPKARENAREARADANYEVAKEKCDDLAGNAKDVCVKEAKAAYVKAKADAKVDRVAADTRKDSADKTAEARREALPTSAMPTTRSRSRSAMRLPARPRTRACMKPRSASARPDSKLPPGPRGTNASNGPEFPGRSAFPDLRPVFFEM